MIVLNLDNYYHKSKKDKTRWIMDTITVKATYDGSSFKIHEPIDLEPNTEYIITVEKKEIEKSVNAIEFLIRNAGTIHGPSNFSEEHDHYLYGTPKMSKNTE